MWNLLLVLFTFSYERKKMQSLNNVNIMKNLKCNTRIHTRARMHKRKSKVSDAQPRADWVLIKQRAASAPQKIKKKKKIPASNSSTVIKAAVKPENNATNNKKVWNEQTHQNAPTRLPIPLRIETLSLLHFSLHSSTKKSGIVKQGGAHPAAPWFTVS